MSRPEILMPGRLADGVERALDAHFTVHGFICAANRRRR